MRCLFLINQQYASEYTVLSQTEHFNVGNVNIVDFT